MTPLSTLTRYRYLSTTAPPSLAGASQVNSTCPSPGCATRPRGTPGTPADTAAVGALGTVSTVPSSSVKRTNTFSAEPTSPATGT